jgi:hypothetical protein
MVSNSGVGWVCGGPCHELLLDLAETLQAGGELEVVVRRRLGDGGYDGNVVALGADVVCGRDAGDVDIYGRAG